MDISTIDENFKIRKTTDGDCDYYDAAEKPFTVYGGFNEKERGFVKMPYAVAEKVSAGVLWGSGCGAGIRIAFSTDSKKIKLDAEIRDKCLMNHMAFIGSACFSLSEDYDGKTAFIGNFVTDMNGGLNVCKGELNLKGGKTRNYVLHLPLYSGVRKLSLGFDKESKVCAYEKFKGKKKILYYGSSITQGGCASRPDNSYQELVSERTGYDYVNLGFSGSAKAEDVMIECLKNSACDIFVCDYDHNAPDAEYLEKTHKKLYDAFRSSPLHKDLPVIFLSKPDGKRDPNGEKRFGIIKATFDYAKNKGDNVYLIDGRTIYPEEIREHCAVDGCHPTDLGFFFMAKAIIETITGNGL